MSQMAPPSPYLLFMAIDPPGALKACELVIWLA